MDSGEHRKGVQSWRVALSRITAFTNAPDVNVADGWWNDVVGDVPESKTLKMKETALTMEGPFGAGRLTLNIELNRADWLLTPNINLEQDIQEIPNVGTYEQTASELDAQIVRWFKSTPAMTRLAWGGVFILPAADRLAAYGMLSEYLPSIRIDPAGSSELLYQINRPRESKLVPGLTLNRLQKWSSMRLQRVQFIMVPGQQIKGGGNEPGFDSVRLELDINSSGEQTEPLPADRLDGLYVELVELGKEILANGDVP